MTNVNPVYCDVVAGELIYFFHQDNPIAANLLKRIRKGELLHVEIIESMGDKLSALGLQIADYLPFELHLLRVPEGSEIMKINWLFGEYQSLLTSFLVNSIQNNSQTESGAQFLKTHFTDIFHIIPNSFYSLNAEQQESKDEAFTFLEAHQNYKKMMGFDQMRPIEAFCKVLVIDSGIEKTHQLNVVQQINFLAAYKKEEEVNDEKGLKAEALAREAPDDYGHGTAIARMIDDVCPKIPFLVYKIFDKANRATEWNLVAALMAQNDAEVINISLSYGLPRLNCSTCGRLSASTRSYVLEYILADLYHQGGKSIVASGGNNNMDKLSFPARFDYTLAVVSLNGSQQKSSFSNFGDENFWGDKHPNLFAAFGGEKDEEPIFQSPYGLNGWGTSFAAAYMTSMVAYLRSSFQRDGNSVPPGKLNQTVENALKDFFTEKTFAAYKAEDFGHGLVKIKETPHQELIKVWPRRYSGNPNEIIQDPSPVPKNDDKKKEESSTKPEKNKTPMKKKSQKLWPYPASRSILVTLFAFTVLIVIFIILRSTADWPGENTETLVLIGIFILSLLPIILALIDRVIDKGAIVEYAGVKIDFSQASEAVAVSDFKVPENITHPGQPVNDSGRVEILSTLQQAGQSGTVVLDLQDGQAWWETRLLVLLAGAVRNRRPKVIVFVGKSGQGRAYDFQAWAYARDLFPLLLKADARYTMIYHQTLAASKQWALIEPLGKNINYNYNDSIDHLQAQLPVPKEGEASPLVNLGRLQKIAKKYPWMAFDYASGLPNTVHFEQLLAIELQEAIENQETPKSISITSMEALFQSALCRDHVDESWPREKQMETFFYSDREYLAFTHDGKYKALVSRISLLNEAVKSLMNTEG